MRQDQNVTTIAVEVPEEIAVALEGYRDGALTRDEIGRLLSLSLWETEAFLQQRQAHLHYTEKDLDDDRRDLDLAQRQ